MLIDEVEAVWAAIAAMALGVAASRVLYEAGMKAAAAFYFQQAADRGGGDRQHRGIPHADDRTGRQGEVAIRQ